MELVSELTSHEIDVLNLLTEGWNAVYIAELLSYRPRTVQRKVEHLYHRFNIDDSRYDKRVILINRYKELR